MANALRFVRYSILVLFEHRSTHRRRGLSETAVAAIGGALFITLPLWLILIGVI